MNSIDLLRGDDDDWGENYGFSVDIDGDRAVVGAWGDEGQGAAYIFHFNGSAWVEEEKLVETGAAADNRFGWGVAIDGDRVVVGAPTVNGAGRAWVFTRSGGVWDSGVQLIAGNFESHVEAPEQMGFSVAIDGDIIAVGERWDTQQGHATGATQVFTFASGSWAHTAKLLPPEVASPPAPQPPVAGDEFGYSVAISGSSVAVGAPATSNSSAGVAYVFEVGGASGQVLTAAANVLPSSGIVSSDFYGISVAIDGDLAVVGASRTDASDGAIYVLDRSGGSWVSSPKIAAPDSGEFGTSVAVSGQVVGAGAPFTDASFNNVGSFYLYVPDGSGGWDKAVDIQSSAVDQLGRDIALDGALLMLGASTANFGYGKAIFYDLTGLPGGCEPGVCDGFMRGWRNAILNP